MGAYGVCAGIASLSGKPLNTPDEGAVISLRLAFAIVVMDEVKRRGFLPATRPEAGQDAASTIAQAASC